MAAIAAFFASPLGRYLAIAAGVIALLGGVWIAGDVHGHHACEAAQQRAVVAATKHMAAADTHIERDIVTPLRTANAATQKAVSDRTTALTQEIPHAIPPAANCVVPGAAVRLLDVAASDLPSVPGSPGGPVIAPPDSTLSDVVAAGVFNAGVAQGALAEDRTWREWYVKARVAYNQATGQK